MAGSGFVQGWTYAAEAMDGREWLWAGAENGAGFEEISHSVRPAR
jgi:hypothetical protein